MKKLLFTCLLAVLVLTLTACPKKNPPASFIFPDLAATIIQGETKDITVSIKRDPDFTESISFSRTALPAGITADNFKPASTTASSSILPLKATSVAKIGEYNITLKATADSGVEKTANLLLKIEAPATITVSGRVVAAFSGKPLDNIEVFIEGHSSVKTKANGQFTISNVTAPYDLIAIKSSSKVVMIYQGLTRTDPIIFFQGFSEGSKTKSAKIEGTVSGGAAYPLPPSYVSKIVAVDTSQNEGITYTAGISDKTGAYKYLAKWRNDSTTTIDMHALQWKEAAGVPVAYTGYGKLTGIALTDGDMLKNQDIVLQAIGSTRFKGHVSVPNAYEVDSKKMYINFDNKSFMRTVKDSSSKLDFDYPSPQIAGAKLDLELSARNANSHSLRFLTGLALNTGPINIEIPKAAEPLKPDNNATEIDNSTSFSWSSFANGIYFVEIVRSFDLSHDQPFYYFYTKDTSITIPDLTAFGLELPKSTEYEWDIVGIAPYKSVDQAAALEPFSDTYYTQPDVQFSHSELRKFKTAP